MADWFSATSQKDSSEVGAPEAGLGGKTDELPFRSRRSPVLCRRGCVASSQPLASSIGLDMLRKGANAAEAAIAVAATLCVTEPCSTGLGGDMFCLYYDAKTKSVSAVNGSGLSPKNISLEMLQKVYPDGKGGDRKSVV